MTVGLVGQNARADGAAGTWTGTCTESSSAADRYYDATLTLDDSLSGTLELTCTREVVKISGFGSGTGGTTTARVQGTMSGSTLTLNLYYGGYTYTYTLTVSGGKMTGGGQYVGAVGQLETWTFDLTGGGIFGSFDIYSLAIPSASLSFIGGILGLVASSLPAPRGLMGFRGRTRNRPNYHHPYVTQIPYRAHQPSPPPVAAPPPAIPPPFGAPAPAAGPAPLKNPNDTLVMLLRSDIGPTDGGHLVPWDAPRQCDQDKDPQDYPYPKGTSATMRCPYCGCNTLSPFTTGWYCTNPLCPARRELLEKGCTHHQFNNMTWRRL